MKWFEGPQNEYLPARMTADIAETGVAAMLNKYKNMKTRTIGRHCKRNQAA
jgi:hypothetical protein